ncbi:MAG: galactokinase [Acidobacteria bacterium]|nr:galactokinase [Acidobacteriota bacterium]
MKRPPRHTPARTAPAVIADDMARRFAARFGGPARVYRAPGRVNLIGEHTDYNDGFVMPMAIDASTWVAIALRDDRRLVVHSETVGETFEAVLDGTTLSPRRHWSDYVVGVAVELIDDGAELPGANMLVWSEVPRGAGLSSSAALEVSVGFALLDSVGRPIDRVALARLCQRAENVFVGARVGIMDQFIACHGVADAAVWLDCRSLDFRTLHLPTDVRVIICNTMVKHAIAAGEYNTRRAECEAAAAAIARSTPGVHALRDVTPDDLDRVGPLLSPVLFRRARHVVTENRRVLQAAEALDRLDVVGFGALMSNSHASLRDDFAVSCRELDVMVEIASALPGVYGARMTGGGFGGCTVNLVATTAIDTFLSTIAERYAKATGIQPDLYISTAADAVQRVVPVA